MPENERIALVTGGSRGIGRAIALALAARGCKVVVNYCSSDVAAEEVVKQIKNAGGNAIAIKADVSSEEDVKSLFKTIKKEWGPVEILVNNAGITRDNLLIRLKDSDWDDVLDGNLKSAFLCSREAVKQMMRSKWGRIVNMASVVGLIGNPGQANYCASKAGIIGLTKSIAREYAVRKITVNAIAPGFIETDMTKALPETVKEEMLKSIPAGRLGQPEDIAQAVLFLTSEQSTYINGQVIAVDGGMTMV